VLCSTISWHSQRISTKRKLSLAAGAVVLTLLAYLQFHTWRNFDWHFFSISVRQLRYLNIAAAVALTYFAYFLRAVRWKIFLRPVCDVPVSNLVPPQFIGFTALALLGRPGELVRPYLIANRQDMTVASQLAVWTVERICDLGAFAFLLVLGVFAAGSSLPFSGELRRAASVLGALVGLMAMVAVVVRFNAPIFARWADAMLPTRTARLLKDRIEEFGDGFNTINDVGSFLQICTVSLALWAVIALVYRLVLNAPPGTILQHLGTVEILVLIGCSMLGSLIQLPGMGGGSQLATIAILASGQWFAVPKELAVSCGILLWLVCFVAVIPIGIFFAIRGHVLLRRMIEAEP
jgi:uncharacterized protein (TIRG00374 family)